MKRLANKVAFITGTAGGMGRAAAVLFAGEGAHIIGCDVNDTGETVDMVRSAGGTMDCFYPVDLANFEASKRWIHEGLAKAGKIDILYNNAGAVEFALMAEMTPESWSFTMRNELDLIFNTTKAAWPHFEKQKQGVILNTSSICGHRGHAGLGASAHAATKGGVIALTKQFAAEGAPLGIRANSISPGSVLTPGFIAAHSAESLESIEQSHPIGRAGRPEDIAYCALYLVSDEASWVTGSDFVLDGGVTSIV